MTATRCGQVKWYNKVNKKLKTYGVQRLPMEVKTVASPSSRISLYDADLDYRLVSSPIEKHYYH